ncbi:hypothetical protein VTJ49DRAFT_4181 [Mycothermus thermophilus]|uniref:Uncharacterized protein n=1 Tax=Humicola insolens TaxID=85995 RepID=A0ABR3V636_HUMIN
MMGKPSTTPPPVVPGGSSSNPDSGMPVRGHPVLNDEDAPVLRPDDLPPLYSDIDNDTTDPHSRFISDLTSADADWNSETYYVSQRRIDSDGNETVVSKRLDEDPELLQAFIQEAAAIAPRPAIRITGTHTERRTTVDNKTESKTVVDFDIQLPLRPYLFSDPRTGESWARLRTVENVEVARRGTIFSKRAPVPPHLKQQQQQLRDVEQPGGRPAVDAMPKPTLKEWCHRYCASNAALKSFVLRRRVLGFDQDRMSVLLKDLVRGTGYRGKVSIKYPVEGEYVHVMNDCRINRWRATGWIRWMFYLSFLWIFSWPVLFFSTKRWEVAVAEWPFSTREPDLSRRFVSMSEDHIYNLWGRAIRSAVLGRRQGTLDQRDLLTAETRPNDHFQHALGGSSPALLKHTLNAMTANDEQVGWGRDS